MAALATSSGWLNSQQVSSVGWSRLHNDPLSPALYVQVAAATHVHSGGSVCHLKCLLPQRWLWSSGLSQAAGYTLSLASFMQYLHARLVAVSALVT